MQLVGLGFLVGRLTGNHMIGVRMPRRMARRVVHRRGLVSDISVIYALRRVAVGPVADLCIALIVDLWF